MTKILFNKNIFFPNKTIICANSVNVFQRPNEHNISYKHNKRNSLKFSYFLSPTLDAVFLFSKLPFSNTALFYYISSIEKSKIVSTSSLVHCLSLVDEK